MRRFEDFKETLKRKKSIKSSGSRPSLEIPSSSSEEESGPIKAGFPTYLSLNDVYEMWVSHPKDKKPTIREFAAILLYESKLEVKDYVIPAVNEKGEPISREEVELRGHIDEAVDRLYVGFKRFKNYYLGTTKEKKKNRLKVMKGGTDANDLFFDLLEEYPMLVKEEESQGLSQSSQRSTNSFCEKKVPKPKSKIRKLFRKLCTAYKRQKTDMIYRQVLIVAEELDISATELIGYLGFRANYLTNKKVAHAFIALSKGDLKESLSLDKAIYMKFRYNFSKRDWIDFRLDFEEIMMPTDGRLREQIYKLLPDADLIPFKKGWRMEVSTVVQRTLDRLPPVIKDSIAESGSKAILNFSAGFDGCGDHRVTCGKSTFDDDGNFISSKSIIFCGMALTKVTLDDEEDTVIWRVPNSASSDAEAPVMIVADKECTTTDKEIMKHLDDGAKAACKKTFFTEHNGQQLECQVNIDLCQLDGKAHKDVQGRLGAFCLLCSVPREEMKNRNQVLEGFPMDCGIAELWENFYDVADIDEDGEYYINKKDIPTVVRMGATGPPMAEFLQLGWFLPPLHCYLRFLAFFIEMAIRFRAKNWLHGKIGDVMKKKMDLAKRAFREDALINLEKRYQFPDNGGSSDNGNAAR